MQAGVWIANISRTHALYVEGDGYRIRLPRMEHDGEPADGWFVHAGTVYVGSRAMLDEQQPLAVTVTGQFEGWSGGAPQAAGAVSAEAGAMYRASRADPTGRTDGAALAAGTGFADVARLTNGAGPASEANGAGVAWAGGPGPVSGTSQGSGTGGAKRAGGTGGAGGYGGTTPDDRTRQAGETAPTGETGPARSGRGGTGPGSRTGPGSGTGPGGTGPGGTGPGGTGPGGTGPGSGSGPGGGTGSTNGTALNDGTRAADGTGSAGGTALEAGTGLADRTGATGEAGLDDEAERGGGEGTLLPFYIDPMTKLFLVALIWCRPWLLDQSATRPLPRTPEIARGALEVTGAYHELERFNSDSEFRDLLSARVAEHIKVLRRKIADHGLAGTDVRLSDEVAVRILIDHGIITTADLGRVNDPAWRSRQENLWWTQD